MQLTLECFTCLQLQNTQLLSQFLSESTGQILRRDITGVSAKQQRKLAKAVKRARHFGLLPYLHVSMHTGPPSALDEEVGVGVLRARC